MTISTKSAILSGMDTLSVRPVSVSIIPLSIERTGSKRRLGCWVRLAECRELGRKKFEGIRIIINYYEQKGLWRMQKKYVKTINKVEIIFFLVEKCKNILTWSDSFHLKQLCNRFRFAFDLSNILITGWGTDFCFALYALWFLIVHKCRISKEV